MEQRTLRVIDCLYTGREKVAAAFLLKEGDRAAIVETNTNHAIPHIMQTMTEEGVQPEQVEWIIVTHAHLDHAGGASALLKKCPNATLVAHPKAAPHLIDPSRLLKSAKDIYGEETFQELYGTIKPIPEDRVKVPEDGESLSLGERELRLFFTRGHANHHFCVHDVSEKVVFAGDNFGIIYPALQHHGLFAFPSTPPTDFDALAAIESIDKILATGANRVFPTHFGEVTELEAIASQLREQLQTFHEWIEEVDASGQPDEALDALFDKRIRAHFDTKCEALGIPADNPHRRLLEIDVMLNGQGLSFAVKKRRYKRKKKQNA